MSESISKAGPPGEHWRGQLRSQLGVRGHGGRHILGEAVNHTRPVSEWAYCKDDGGPLQTNQIKI